MTDTLNNPVRNNYTDAQDASILLPIVNAFFTHCIERSNTDLIADAVSASVEDTGINFKYTLLCLERMGLMIDEEWFRREYNVTITVPVSLTVTVEAHNTDDAEQAALDLVETEGIENYMLDYSLHYDSEVVEITEV